MTERMTVNNKAKSKAKTNGKGKDKGDDPNRYEEDHKKNNIDINDAKSKSIAHGSDSSTSGETTALEPRRSGII
jgi:hypothetical protein